MRCAKTNYSLPKNSNEYYADQKRSLSMRPNNYCWYIKIVMKFILLDNDEFDN
jgi:hypothetical protein